MVPAQPHPQLAWLPAALLAELRDDPPPGIALGEFPVSWAQHPQRTQVTFAVADDEAAEAALAQLPALRVVQALSAGVEGLLPRVPAGVVVCNASGVYDAPVAEWVVGAILAAAKRLPDALALQRAHDWQEGLPTALVAGTTALIIGYGSIGAAVEQRLAPFGVELLRVARRARAGVATVDELPRLLGAADVVILLAPLTPETERLIDADALAAMRPGALLVNASRGRLVDTDALLAAARDGHVRAVLDVADPEPLPPDHPLWDAPGVLITPHWAGRTPAAGPRTTALVRDQLTRFAAGEPLANVVHDGY